MWTLRPKDATEAALMRVVAVQAVSAGDLTNHVIFTEAVTFDFPLIGFYGARQGLKRVYMSY